MHMLTGILSYVTSPMWFAVLVLSSILTCMEALHEPVYFQPGARALFPDWPISRPHEIAMRSSLTIVVLLLPKLLGATLAVDQPHLAPRLRRRAAVCVPSLLIEQVFSMLLAPIDDGVPLRLRRAHAYRHDGCVGRAGALAIAASPIARPSGAMRCMWCWVSSGARSSSSCAPRFIWWIMPVLAGLLCSVFLAVLDERAELGLPLRALGPAHDAGGDRHAAGACRRARCAALDDRPEAAARA